MFAGTQRIPVYVEMLLYATSVLDIWSFPVISIPAARQKQAHPDK
jgi:hypothetical protein